MSVMNEMPLVASESVPSTIFFSSEADLAGSAVSRKVYAGEEHSEVEIPLSDLLDGSKISVYDEIKSKGYFQIRLQGDRLAFQAGKYIGLIPINDKIAIDVKPRVPLRNVEQLLAIAHLPPNKIATYKRRYDSHAVRADSLLDALAEDLLDAVDEIRENGLFKPYSERRALTSHPKGRILLSESFHRRAAGERSPTIACSFYERGVDNFPNRLIKSALHLLGRCYLPIVGRKGARALLTRINEGCLLFGDVPLGTTSISLSSIGGDAYKDLPPSRNDYQKAASLSLLLLRELGVSLTNVGKEFALSTLVVDMSLVFEDYLRNSLGANIRDEELLVLDGNLGAPNGAASTLFVEDGAIRLGKNEPATPDILVKGTGALEKIAPLIIDAKYKVVKPRADRDDINQIVTYVLRYGGQSGVLVFPSHARAPAGLHLLGKIGHITLHQYNIDLAAKDLIAEEGKFAMAMESLARSS